MALRIWTLVALELRSAWRRPLWWVLLATLLLLTWGLSSGSVQIGTGGSSANAQRAWLNSQFNLAWGDVIVFTFIYSFFISVAFGNAILDDEENRTGPILHGTRLSMAEYVIGRWLGVAAVACAVMTLHLLVQLVFYELYPVSEPLKMRGPTFEPWNYLRVFALFVGLPVLCLGALTFAIGAVTRHAVLVFLVPVALFLGSIFFFWDWSPEWLSTWMNRALCVMDPTGFRWLNEMHLKADLGADHYNRTPVPIDALLALNRGWMLALAAASLTLTVVVERRRLRHPFAVVAQEAARIIAAQDAQAAAAPVRRADADPALGTLAMGQRAPVWLRTFLAQAGAEARELRRSPGLWIFIPLITLQVLGSAFFRPGPFDTPMLITPGAVAQSSFNTVTLLTLLLLLFYSTESMARDDRQRMTPILASTAARSSARLLGKMFANLAVVVLAVLLAIYAAIVVSVVIQGFASQTKSDPTGIFLAPNPMPLLQAWTIFLLPTVLAWLGLIALVWNLVRNRYAVYAAGLGVLILTGWVFARGWANWVGNWHMWDGVRWTDFGPFQLDARALVLNRLFWLLVAALLMQVALMANRRRTPDPTGIASRIRPVSILKGTLKTLPIAVPAVVLMIMLAVAVRAGGGGGPAERAAKAYRAANAETWRNFKDPFIQSMDLDIRLDPAAGTFVVAAEYVLSNPYDAPMERFALSPGRHFEDLRFTFEGAEHTEDSAEKARRATRDPLPVENSAGLWVFRPSKPLAKGGTARVAFQYHGSYPDGIGRNSRGANEFILPSGVVLNCFSTSYLPMVGWSDSVGVDEEDQVEPRRPDPEEWKKQTKPGFGTGAATVVRSRITLPEQYRANAPGILESDTVADGWRTMTWVTDHPVRFSNIVAGRLQESKGELTSIWHLPAHSRNVPAMLEALDGARRWYSEWFYPYPWKELRITEFPGLSSYAQGFATNIVFSESIGFLAKPTLEQDAPFLVTAHESAHQWWGNILMPGDGPGGNILSEGLAHYSTARLLEKLRGEQARQSFLRGIEKNYVDTRAADEERPMVEIDGARKGDTTVTYDKGGWVFWMLHNLMGTDAADAGMRDFITRFKDGPDYPLLQDFVLVMREHAQDQAAYDAFVKQWFFDVLLPEFKVEKAQAVQAPDGTWTTDVTIKNSGSGRATVAVAATNGKDRWAEVPEGEQVYADARGSVTLGADESATIQITTPWPPVKVVVDPDVHQLQRARKTAERSVDQ